MKNTIRTRKAVDASERRSAIISPVYLFKAKLKRFKAISGQMESVPQSDIGAIATKRMEVCLKS